MRRMHRSFVPLLAAATVVGSASIAEAQESYRLQGDRVAIYNLAGEVEVVPGSGSEVVVTVSMGGADAARLSVEVGDIRGQATLSVVYPGDRIVYARPGGGRYRSTVRIREDGTFGGGMGGEQVEIASGGSGLEAHADIRVEVPQGMSAAVHNAVGPAEARGVRGDLTLRVRSGSISVTDITGDVELDTGSGAIQAEDILGSLEVDTGSGDVTLARVVAPRVFVDTGSGRVEGRGIETDRLEVDTGSGRVELMDLGSPDVTVDTGSGSVELELTAPVERLEVDTGSGSVTVLVPSALSAEVEVDTGSGGIDVDLPIDVRTSRRGYFMGRAGDGGGRILIDTGSGDVRIRGN